MESQELRFITHVVRQIKDHGIDLQLIDVDMIYDPSVNIHCEGWFDDVQKEMVIALRQEPQEFILTLSHEFCHMLQWKDGCEIFRTVNRSIGIMENFIKGKIKRSDLVNQAINNVQNMELDCEKRNMKLLKDWKLYDDNCIRKANSYIYFYSALKETGMWYKNPPTKVPKILSVMPINFKKDYKISKNLLKLYIKYCY